MSSPSHVVVVVVSDPRPRCCPRVPRRTDAAVAAAAALLLFCIAALPPVHAVSYESTVTFDLKLPGASAYTPTYPSPSAMKGGGLCALSHLPFESGSSSDSFSHASDDDVAEVLGSFGSTFETPMEALDAYYTVITDSPFLLDYGATITVALSNDGLTLATAKYQVYADSYLLSPLLAGRAGVASANATPAASADVNMRNVGFFAYNQPRLHCLFNAPVLLDLLDQVSDSPNDELHPTAAVQPLRAAFDFSPGGMPAAEESMDPRRREVDHNTSTGDRWSAQQSSTAAAACSCEGYIPSSSVLRPASVVQQLTNTFMISEVNLQVMVFDAETWFRLTDGAAEESASATTATNGAGARATQTAQQSPYNLKRDPAKICTAPALYTVPLAPLIAKFDYTNPNAYENVAEYYTPATSPNITHNYPPVRVVVVVAQCSAIPLSLSLTVTLVNSESRTGSAHYYYSSIMYFVFMVGYAILFVVFLAMIVRCEKRGADAKASAMASAVAEKSGKPQRQREREGVGRDTPREGSNEDDGNANNSSGGGSSSNAERLKRRLKPPRFRRHRASRSPRRSRANTSEHATNSSTDSASDRSSSSGSSSSSRSSSSSTSSSNDSGGGSDSGSDVDSDRDADDARSRRRGSRSGKGRSLRDSSRRRDRRGDAARDARGNDRGQSLTSSARGAPSPVRCLDAMANGFRRAFHAFQSWWLASHIDIMFPALQWMLVVLIPLKCLISILRAAEFSLLSGMEVVDTSYALPTVSIVLTVCASTVLFVLEVLVALGWGLAFANLTSGRIVALSLSCICGFSIYVASSTCPTTGWSDTFTKSMYAMAESSNRCRSISYTRVAVETTFHIFNAITMSVQTRLLGKVVGAYAASPRPPLTSEDLKYYYNVLPRKLHKERRGGRRGSSSEVGSSDWRDPPRRRHRGREDDDDDEPRRHGRAATTSPHSHTRTRRQSHRRSSTRGHSLGDRNTSSSSSSRQQRRQSWSSDRGRSRTAAHSLAGSFNSINNSNSSLGDESKEGRFASSAAALLAKRRRDEVQVKLMKLYLRYRGMRVAFCFVVFWPVLFIGFSCTFFDISDYYMEIFFSEMSHLYLCCFILLFMRHESFYC